MLAKLAFCQLPTDDDGGIKWDDMQQIELAHWWDGQPIGT
jgi:hypothetical protein